MVLEKWILEELEDMPIEMLADAVENGILKPLLINDGHVVGCENTQEVEDCGKVLHCNA